MSNLKDFFNIPDEQLYPLPSGSHVTGNMHGLGYSYNNTGAINVFAGICYDSLNKNVLTLSANAVVAIVSPVINTVYNVFLTDAGDIQFDTDVDGATLLAGAVSHLRWVGFVRTNASGEICLFVANNGLVIFGKASENILGTSSTVSSAYDHSILLPVNRVKAIEYGSNGNYQPGTSVYSTDTFGNVIARLASKTNIVVTSDTAYYAWGADGGILVPFDKDILLAGTVTSSNVNILVHMVDTKR